MFEFRMPALGADMEKGILAAWHVKPGDSVRKGDIVADVETDKGTIEVEIWEAGEVTEILVHNGEEVPVGTTLATLKSIADSTRLTSLPVATTTTLPEDVSGAIGQQEPSPLASPASTLPSLLGGNTVEGKHLRVSPLARKLAKRLGVDLALVPGSGPGAAITRGDVEEFVARDKTPVSSPLISKNDRDVTMRRAIALTVSRSKREIPHYYLKTDVNMALALRWLKEENARVSVSERLLPVVLGLKAIAHAVKKVPEINGHFLDGAFQAKTDVHLGVAIALRGGGLVAPAIHNADQMSLNELMRNLMDLVRRARSGKLRSSEVSDPTITLTNLGDTGVDSVFGVIHPPQVAMVGFGRIAERPWAINGMLGTVPILTVTLAADHRASDGHRGSLFLSAVDNLLQNPQLL